MLFGNLCDRFMLEGIMPERALLRLKRAGITLYNVKKTEKKRILFSVRKKDSEKVFAIYPNVCYNITAYHPYVVKKIGGEGIAKYVDAGKKRAGFLLGALLFCAITLGMDSFVLGVRFVGTQAYAREIMTTLEEYGVKSFFPYRKGKEDMISAKLLAIPSVEFCSVKKEGFWLRVEIRTSPFSTDSLDRNAMLAKHTGEIVALTVLRGSALKKIGDTVTVGDTLVGNWFSTEDGEQVRVEPIARVRIACTYESVSANAEDREIAFANAYLALELSDKDEITACEIVKTDDGFHVKISYVVTETINF